MVVYGFPAPSFELLEVFDRPIATLLRKATTKVK